MMLIDPVALAGQAAAESGGTAVTASALAAGTPGMLSPVPMSMEEGGALFASALAALGAQYLAMAGLAAMQREAFAATVGVSGAVYAATEAANMTGLTA